MLVPSAVLSFLNSPFPDGCLRSTSEPWFTNGDGSALWGTFDNFGCHDLGGKWGMVLVSSGWSPRMLMLLNIVQCTAQYPPGLKMSVALRVKKRRAEVYEVRMSAGKPAGCQDGALWCPLPGDLITGQGQALSAWPLQKLIFRVPDSSRLTLIGTHRKLSA